MTDHILHDFARTHFTHDGKTRPVFFAGVGSGVIVIHEVPGITPEVVRFARWVVDAGFRVAMPSLFGVPGNRNRPDMSSVRLPAHASVASSGASRPRNRAP